HDFGTADGAVGGERLAQIFVAHGVRQVADIKLVAHVKGLLKTLKRSDGAPSSGTTMQRAKPTDHLTCGRLARTPRHYAPFVELTVTKCRAVSAGPPPDARLQQPEAPDRGRILPPSAD